MQPDSTRPMSAYAKFLSAATALVFIWSMILPADMLTWAMEAAPVVIGTIVLVAIRKRFRFTDFTFTFIIIEMLVLLIGAHYTYAEVPLFNWIRDAFDLMRNHYDRVGHFCQGLVPAMIAREILIRLRVVNGRVWRFWLILGFCLGISAAYEIIEFIAANILSEKADAFLGTQGDVWDTQWDMTMCLIGASVGLVFFGGAQDKALARIDDDRR